MTPLRTFLMEEVLEAMRHTARYNLVESGSRPSTVAELLVGAGLSREVAAEALLATSLRDSPNWGRGDLRALVAGFHPGAAPDDVLITTGTSEALLLLFRALRPRRTALVWPAFQLLYEIPASLGSDVVRLPVRWDAGGAPLVDDREWAAVLERTRPDCVVLNVPHNPSGLVLEADRLDALVERALALGATVIGDEHYRWLAGDAPLGATVFRPSPRVFVTGSYIKCLGCPGLRIGWCVGGGRDVLSAMQSEKNYVTHTVNPISEWISVQLLRDPGAPIWLAHRRIWSQNRRALGEHLARSAELVGAAPGGGLVTCVGFRRARSHHDLAALFGAIADAGVAVLPLSRMELGAAGDADHPLARGLGFRLGLGAEPDDFARALGVLDEACAGALAAPRDRRSTHEEMPRD